MKHVIALFMLLWGMSLCYIIVFMNLSFECSLGFGALATLLGYWVYTLYADNDG